MTTPTENPNTSAQDDIRIVLQETLIEQATTILNFTRTEGFALQVPDTDTLILVGRAGKIREFLGLGTSAALTPYNSINGEPCYRAIEVDALLASQSQAAQPTELTPERIYALWKERGGDGAPAALRFARAIESEVVAHIAGTSQADVAALEAENDKLRAALGDSALAATMLHKLSVENGGINAVYSGGAAQLLAEALGQQFTESGAENYLEVGFNTSTGVRLLVTLQRCDGKTPSTFRREAEEKLAEVTAELEQLRAAGTSQATKAQAEPTPEMLRAAVKFMNWIDIYEKVPRGVTEIEEGIYAEVFKAMMLAAPVAKEAPAVLEDIAVSQMDRAQLQVEVFRLRSKTAPAMGGYVSVPVEPTEAMVHAAEDLPAPRMFAKVYRAMIAAAPVASVAKEATRDAESVRAKPIAAAVRAAERVDAMHKGVVGVFAAIKAEHHAQANVLLPFAAPASQHGAWIAAKDQLPEKYCLAVYETSRGKQRIIRAMHVNQYEIEATGDECDSETNDANDIEYIKAGWYECIDNWGDYSSVAVCEGVVTHWMPLPPTPDQMSTAGSAKGGITNESGSDLATTTSTVSAPLGYVSDDAMATLLAGSGVLTAIIPRAINGAERAIYLGAQKAPEEVRNQALTDAEDAARTVMDAADDASESAEGIGAFRCVKAIQALRTSSTDQANADTGSAA